MNVMNQLVSKTFETGFMSASLADQVRVCDRDELASAFLHWFADRQPVLEAGCGSGRWCAWLGAHGISADGIDWSQELCSRASREIPGSAFVAGDMRNMPFPDGKYGGIIALGSIEHTVEGPAAVLAEFRRVLQADGIALITVPYGARLRLLVRALVDRPALFLRANWLLRRIFKHSTAGVGLREARLSAVSSWHPRFQYGENGWGFYEYEFSRTQMREFLGRAGFVVVEERVIYRNAGLLHTFGRMVGKWNAERQDVDLTWMGRVLRGLFSGKASSHMLCYVVRKK
jgi:SAM-dependent methyltransferase